MCHFLAYLKQNTTVDPEDLDDYFLELDESDQSYVSRVCETAFMKAKAKLQKYISDGGQLLSF